jgi:hypothetical protein
MSGVRTRSASAAIGCRQEHIAVEEQIRMIIHIYCDVISARLPRRLSIGPRLHRTRTTHCKN